MSISEMAHILIVEDDINLGQILFQELKRNSHDVELVENGEAALARINKYIYDLMLTDLKLPGLDGIELLKKVKVSTLSTIVIVMTGYASVDTAVVAMKNGAQDLFRNPLVYRKLFRK
jgi:DNA-binding NtrC family response regulator